MADRDRVDAIVVLGAAVWSGGRPSPILRGRLSHAVALFQAGAGEYLLFSGGVGKHPPSEAEVMARIARDAGVPSERLVLERNSTNTLENALHCRAILRAHGWQRITVVTDDYHLPRALLAFRLLGLHASGSAPPRDGDGVPRWLRTYAILRELVALPWYVLRLLPYRVSKRPV